MRQRTTFFHLNEDAIDPLELKIQGRSISGPSIRAVREDKFTFGLDELPSEVREILPNTAELHLRWSSSASHDLMASGPWTSRLPPGLHAFYTPHEAEQASDPICIFLGNTSSFHDCSQSLDRYTRLPNDRFSHSTAFQAYLPISRRDLGGFPVFAADYICPDSDDECSKRIHDLDGVDLLDVSYDTMSHVVKITVLWGLEEQPLKITGHPDHRVEIGLLTPNAAEHLEDHDIGVAGLLTVLGEDTKPSPVMFSFPTRHKAAGATFTSDFTSPTSLHPTLQLHISSSKPPVDDTYCSLHAYFTLPNSIFADKYQLEDPLFLSSKNLTALRFITHPVDLEAPDYVLKSWGSSVLLELKPSAEDEDFTAEIPLHLRYKKPNHGGEESLKVPYPAVFWACAAEEGTKFPNNPFDRVNLGYDGLFGPRTLFWHLDPAPQTDNLMLTASVPVLDLNKTQWVGTSTGAAVLIGFAFVTWKLMTVFLRSGHGLHSKVNTEKKSQ
ncbi:protein pbn1 protein [Seiridium cupressi]